MEGKQIQYQLLTIEEMRELTKIEPYTIPDDELEFHDEGTPEGGWTWFIDWKHPNLLRDHLLIELCVKKHWINWKWTTNVYDPYTIAYMKYLWYHPLVWVPITQELTKGRIITGRVAEERFVKRDSKLVDRTPIGFGFENVMLDWFAERLPLPDGTEPIIIFDYKFSSLDVIQWYYITRKSIDMENATWGEDGKFDPSLLIPFDPRTFSYNLDIIAERHGGSRAAEIVRLLRKDWKRITTMKFFDIGKMSAEQIEEFRLGLFDGMDYYLEQWDAEMPKEEAQTPAKQRGPKMQYLFADVNRNEDTERTSQEAERVKRYIADHHMGNMHLDSNQDNQLSRLVACFYYEWRERGWVSPQPQGAAIHRFLTERCNIPCDVTPRAYARVIVDLIKGEHKDYNIIDNLRSYFK